MKTYQTHKLQTFLRRATACIHRANKNGAFSQYIYFSESSVFVTDGHLVAVLGDGDPSGLSAITRDQAAALYGVESETIDAVIVPGVVVLGALALPSASTPDVPLPQIRAIIDGKYSDKLEAVHVNFETFRTACDVVGSDDNFIIERAEAFRISKGDISVYFAPMARK